MTARLPRILTSLRGGIPGQADWRVTKLPRWTALAFARRSQATADMAAELG